jgi:hypothetical protein
MVKSKQIESIRHGVTKLLKARNPAGMERGRCNHCQDCPSSHAPSGLQGEHNNGNFHSPGVSLDNIKDNRAFTMGTEVPDGDLIS